MLVFSIIFAIVNAICLAVVYAMAIKDRDSCLHNLFLQLLATTFLSATNVLVVREGLNVYVEFLTTAVSFISFVYVITIGRRNVYKNFNKACAIGYLKEEGVDLNQFAKMSREEQISFLVKEGHIDDENDFSYFAEILNKAMS